MTAPRLCACGRRPPIGVVRVASEDGLLLLPVCADCADPDAEILDLHPAELEAFERRPLTAMPGREGHRDEELEDEIDESDEEHDAA